MPPPQNAYNFRSRPGAASSETEIVQIDEEAANEADVQEDVLVSDPDPEDMAQGPPIQMPCFHGNPGERGGKNFMSKLVKALCEMLEITRHHTSSYHPQTNSTVERVSSTLAQTLRAYINKEQTNWPSLLPSIMMAFRSSPCSESTQFTPFHLLFGREMNLPVDTSLIPKPTLGQNARK